MDASEESLHQANTSLSQAELENERRENVETERLGRRKAEEELKIW
jgi:hypothetical protein